MWFIPFSFRDFIDVLLVALLMFWAYRSLKINNAPMIIIGVISAALLWVIVKAFNMELVTIIFEQIIAVGVIAMIVLFQPELRRMLQNLSMRRHNITLLSRLLGDGDKSNLKAFMPIIECAATMSRSHRGGLIVIAQSSDLTLITESGVDIDAKLSTLLLSTIYAENSPLTDGAVVISSGRILAAKCVLPITQSDVPMSLGMRHRAAVGLSEISDAIIVVISAQTGQISLVRAGNITRDLSADDLARELVLCFEPQTKKEAQTEVVR